MAHNRGRSVMWNILSKLLGFVIFLIILAAVNVLDVFIQSTVFHQIVQFLNDNIALILIMSVVFLIQEVFASISFPFNLPWPLFAAVGAVFLTTFVLRAISLVDTVTGEPIFSVINSLSFLLYPLVFVLVLIGCYISLFAEMADADRHSEHTEDRPARCKRR